MPVELIKLPEMTKDELAAVIDGLIEVFNDAFGDEETIRTIHTFAGKPDNDAASEIAALFGLVGLL